MRDDAGLDELLATARGAGPSTMAKIIAFAREAIAAERSGVAGLDTETQAWLDADLTAALEPFDWGDIDPATAGRPIEWSEESHSFIVVGGKE